MNNPKVLKIIIADDETSIRILIRKIAISMGMIISGEALNGEAAVRLYKSEKPDLVLMDINMPVKDGEEALKEIIDYDKKARVIMLTSVADIDNVKKCIEYGACGYIRKDNPIEKIRVLIKEIINRYKINA